MSHSIAEMTAYLEETAEELNDLNEMDVMEMYRQLTNLGNAMPRMSEDKKIPGNFVHGCTSNVYIAADCQDGRMSYFGSSEALIVRGYVAILCTALTGLSAEDILERSREPIERFADITNIRATLTPSRANAFGNIYALMRRHAEGCLSR